MLILIDTEGGYICVDVASKSIIKTKPPAIGPIVSDFIGVSVTGLYVTNFKIRAIDLIQKQ